MLSIVYTGRLL